MAKPNGRKSYGKFGEVMYFIQARVDDGMFTRLFVPTTPIGGEFTTSMVVKTPETNVEGLPAFVAEAVALRDAAVAQKSEFELVKTYRNWLRQEIQNMEDTVATEDASEDNSATEDVSEDNIAVDESTGEVLEDLEA